METNEKTLKLKCDSGLENAAVNDILSLFSERWEDTSKKSAREVMTFILEKMKDACLAYESEENSEEHLKLLHANNYFSKLIKHFQSNEPLMIAITGNSFEDSMRNIYRLKIYAEKESYSKVITERINHFQTKLREQASVLSQKQAKSYKGSLLISLVVGIALALFIFNIGEDVFQSPFESFGTFGLFLFIVLALMGAVFGAVQSIKNKK